MKQQAETCSDCGRDIPAHVDRFYEVIGWIKPRHSGGGVNAVARSKRTGKVRCSSCMADDKAGVIPGQQELI